MLGDRRISCRSIRGLGAIALLALASACSKPTSSKTPGSARPSEDEPAATEKNSAEPALVLPEGSLVSFQTELAHVSKIRQLAIQGETKGLLVAPDELLRHVEKTVALETPAHAIAGTELMLVSLGVVPLNFNFKETMLSLLGKNLQGLYDPRLKAMLVRSDLKENRKPTLLHELVHALQDQHYDLTGVVEWTPDDTDRSSALSSLAEGDATSAMFDALFSSTEKTALDLPPGYIQKQFGALDENPSDPTPRAVRSSLVAPYIDGTLFVHALRKRGGWAEVNRVWKSPPTTTEQILHIDKYDNKEAPLAVSVPEAPGADWKLLLSDTWGEQSLRLILEDWTEKEIAATAAAGWGGDRIAAYENNKEVAMAWSIEMDTRLDAEELYRVVVSRQHREEEGPAEEKPLSTEELHCEDSGADRLAVSLRGSTVTLTSGYLDRAGGSVGNCAQAQGWNETLIAKSTSDGN